MHADRVNRAFISLIGISAMALGIGGLLAAAGVFGHRFQHRQLTDNGFSRYVGGHGTWLWPAIAAVTLLLVLLALLWLVRLLFSTDRSSDITIAASRAGSDHSQNAAGRTTLAAAALSQAVAREIETYHGVIGAKARVLGDATQPTLAIQVAASRHADLADLIQRIENGAVAHARQSLEQPELAVKLDMAVTDKKIARTE